MPSLTIQILLAFLFVSVGFIGGALVAVMWTERERRSAKTRQEPPAEEPEEELTRVAALWRDAKTGQLVTEIKGKYYEAHDKLSPNQHLELAKTVRDWRNWLGLSAETPVQAPPMPQSNETIRVEVPRPATPARPPVNGVDTVIALSAAPIVNAAAETSQPTLTPAPQPRPVDWTPPAPPKKNAKGKDEKSVPMMSIVGQIDEILQEMVEGTEMEKLGIRLAEDPKQGVVVWIGLDHYFGIDSVPNPDALKLLRTAVAEWERRQEERIQATRIPK